MALEFLVPARVVSAVVGAECRGRYIHLKNRGRKMMEAAYPLALGGRYCPRCGRVSHPGALICRRCGRSHGLRFDPWSLRIERKKVYLPPGFTVTR